ncbi:MAG: protein kinase [Candidatus Melainabacteria bacterium]|nr:protein kinase [Candidatus Melainabacteria bacterium]
MNSPFKNVTFSHEQYMVLEELGRGGMGIVYRCKDRKLMKEVAVKVIGWNVDDEAIIRFHKEATTLGKLQHRNILGVQHFGHSDDDSLYLVMDLLTGRSLSELIELQKLPSFEEALEIFIQLCDGLGHAHGKGILHRDIKPSNVFIARYEAGELQVVITDFGLAKLVSEDQNLTQAGSTMGSPPYMSPEQCEGKLVDERSDIYSLGCLMFELLTTTIPFQGETIPHLMMQHITEDPPTLAERAPELNFPPEMDRIIAKCLAKNPAERYAKAKLLRTDLQQLRDSICNVSFAQHSEESGAYSPSKSFLRTGAYIITGLQNLARPSQEKKLRVMIYSTLLLIGSGLVYSVWQAIEGHLKYLKTQDALEGFRNQFNSPSHEVTEITLNPVKSKRERSSYRQSRLWISIDKGAKSALQEVAQMSKKQVGFEIGTAPDWINLSKSDVKDEDLEPISSLRILGFMFNKTALTDKGLKIVSNIPTLQELYLDETKITDAGLVYLMNVGNKNLNLITLGGDNITDEGVETISKFGKMAWIELENCKKITGANIELLHNNSDLFHLGLEGSGFKTENFPKLSTVHLASLDLSNLNLTDSDLEKFCEVRVPGLETLLIKNNKEITDRGLLEVSRIKTLNNLHIHGCDKITKAGIDSFHDARGDRPVAVYKE